MTAKANEPVRYEVAHASENSYPVGLQGDGPEWYRVRRVSWKIVVPPTIRIGQIRPTLEQAVDDLKEQYPDVLEAMFLVYSDKAISDDAYDVASAVWGCHGELGQVTPEIARTLDLGQHELRVSVRRGLEDYLKERNNPVQRFGLSDEERREAYKAIVVAEDRAEAEAETLIPLSSGVTHSAIGDHNQLVSDLSDKYLGEMRAKFGITEQVEAAIRAEGFNKRWPTD